MPLQYEKKVFEYCIQQKMFTGGTVLVALSGGGDSVALLNILVQICDDIDITIEAAHLNHSLRGDDSDKDEDFCREICSTMKIPLIIERLKAENIYQNRSSVETAAREARLSFLKRAASERNAKRIATGHTLDDLSETVLQRIIRGTGPSGLSGILPVRDDLFVRPILCISRKDVRDYLCENSIKFREDLTNQDTSFFRNRIRHELIPLLKENYSPNIIGVLARLAELSRIQEEYLDEKTMEAYNACMFHEDNYKILLDKSKFMYYNTLIQQRMARHCLKVLEGVGRDTDKEEIENILSLFTESYGIADITAKVKCCVEGQYAVFSVFFQPFKPLPLEIPGETIIPRDGGRIIVEESSERIKVDGMSSIMINPEIIEKLGVLTVGFVKPGESVIPFGMDKASKIRDIFSSASIPKILRNYVPIIRAGAVPIWIPGLKSSEYLRLNTDNNECKKYIIFTFKDGIHWNYINKNINYINK